MDPQGGGESRRSTAGRGGIKRGGKQLGLKRPSAPAPSPATVHPLQPASSPPEAPSPARTESPAPSPRPAVAAPGSSPAVQMSTMPPWPLQGEGWGAVPPNFAFLQGNQQGLSSWVFPPDGFVSLMQQGDPQQQNCHLVGQSFNNPITPPPQAMKQGSSANNTVKIDVDADETNDASAAAKKRNMRYWTHEEEERLANAWLNASKDPIYGNDKKGDTFWKEVADEFNRKGNGKRTREVNQLKIHWSRLKTSVGEFNDCWAQITQMHTSGYSDDMLEKEAQQIYAGRYEKPFQGVHWWKILKEEPKWKAQFEKDKNKAEVVDITNEHERPIGREAAKAERNGKRKKDSIVEGIVILGDNIDKIVKVQEDRKMEREKVTDAQIQIANTNLKAAVEQKEAKMFEVYNSLINQDVSQMSEDQKANRDKAIRRMEERLLGN